MCFVKTQQGTSLARSRPVFRMRVPLPPLGLNYARHLSASPQRGKDGERACDL